MHHILDSSAVSGNVEMAIVAQLVFRVKHRKSANRDFLGKTKFNSINRFSKYPSVDVRHWKVVMVA